MGSSEGSDDQSTHQPDRPSASRSARPSDGRPSRRHGEKRVEVGEAVDFVFFGCVLGVCVTRIYYEGLPPWWSWLIGAVLLMAVLVAARWARGRV